MSEDSVARTDIEFLRKENQFLKNKIDENFKILNARMEKMAECLGIKYIKKEGYEKIQP